MRITALITAILFVTSFLFSQATSIYTELDRSYKEGLALYEKGIYGRAQHEFQKVINDERMASEQEFKFLKMNAELYNARCSVRMKSEDGEKLILDFVRRYTPDPVADQALIEIADYYFYDKDYENAVKFLQKIKTSGLSEKQRAEVNFKTGYAYFVKKKFNSAKSSFMRLIDIKGDYYYPANYYYGIIAFFNDDYDLAIKSFKRVGESRKYKKYIPYYIAQIYFARGEYDELLKYAVPLLEGGRVSKKKEIGQLVGQAYFEEGNYEKALPFLEEYARSQGNLKEEEFYQLAYTQYQLKKYKKAAKNFEELKNTDSKLGQLAMFAMGDCYLRINKKTSARSAFGKASKMNYDHEVAENSNWNYIKLSYELGADRDAISAINKLNEKSVYYSEGQRLLSDLLLKTRDYDRALSILENMPKKTLQLKETYQKLAYSKGAQFYSDKDLQSAKKYLNKAKKYEVNQKIKAQTLFLKGEIYHQEKDYDRSISTFSKYFILANSMYNLPADMSIYAANYTQGYNYLLNKKYSTALGFFQESIAGIKSNSSKVSPYLRTQILGDAILRAGDCYFKKNNYPKALKYYNEAIGNKYKGFEYALYNKAIILGLQDKEFDKIVALEQMINGYPKSKYADDALLELGATYMAMGELNKAKTPLKKIISKYSNSSLRNSAYLRLGLIAYNQHDLNTAISYYKKVFDKNPTPDEAKSALASLEEIYVDDLGDSDAYFKFVDKVNGYSSSEIEKDDLTFKAAESKYTSGDYDKAIVAFGKYIKRFSRGTHIIEAYFYRGDCYTGKNNYAEALKDYKEVADRGQGKFYIKSLKNVALISYNFENNFSQSFKYYSKWESVAETDEDRLEAQLGASRSAYRAGKKDAVLKMANKVKNNPLSTKTQKAEAEFYIGKVAFDRKKYDIALKSFNTVTRSINDEKAAEARYIIAYIYYVRADYDIAEQLCLNSYQESSAYEYWVAKSVILLSDVFVSQNKLLDAKAALEGLLENYDSDQELVKEAKRKLEAIKKKESRNNRIAPDSDDSTLDMEEDTEEN